MSYLISAGDEVCEEKLIDLFGEVDSSDINLLTERLFRTIGSNVIDYEPVLLVLHYMQVDFISDGWSYRPPHWHMLLHRA